MLTCPPCTLIFSSRPGVSKRSSRIVDYDFLNALWQSSCGNASSWPANPDFRGRFGSCHDLHRAILRPVARSDMNLSRRSEPVAEFQANDRAHSRGISRRPAQANLQTGVRTRLAE